MYNFVYIFCCHANKKCIFMKTALNVIGIHFVHFFSIESTFFIKLT